MPIHTSMQYCIILTPTEKLNQLKNGVGPGLFVVLVSCLPYICHCVCACLSVYGFGNHYSFSLAFRFIK